MEFTSSEWTEERLSLLMAIGSDGNGVADDSTTTVMSVMSRNRARKAYSVNASIATKVSCLCAEKKNKMEDKQKIIIKVFYKSIKK